MFHPYPYDDTNAINRPQLPPESVAAMSAGNDAVIRAMVTTIKSAAERSGQKCLFVAFDGYIGAEWGRSIELLKDALAVEKIGMTSIDIAECYKGSEDLERMLAENLPTDRDIDPVLLFGKIFHGGIEELFDVGRLAERKALWLGREKAGSNLKEVVIIYGCGSACRELRGLYDVIAYYDVTPLQTALRVKAGAVKPLGDSGKRSINEIFRRLYYFDYELAVKHREELILTGSLTFYVDSNKPDNLKLLSLKAFKQVISELVRMPFRCKPVYLEGVWGGQFIKKLRGLPEDMRNCAWVFDLIPNEVSLLVKVGKHTLEIPYPTFFRAVSEELMGPECVRRFGRIFPIRFNYDDTYTGDGNMSIQVHPPAEYAKKNFGEPFQQDESYYVVKTGGSRTYLGFNDDADINEFFANVRTAETEHKPFDYENYVNSFESRRGDQFLLPGGTLHASGRNQVVLEIGSCTVGSYTFKMYDYLRLDLNGIPRPIHSKHGMKVVNKSCRRSAIDGVLRPQTKVLREGDGWKELLLGEHEKIFFSLRRLEFDRCIKDDTNGKFNVLVLVEGEEALVYALDNPEHCYRMKYCDMVVVPASLGRYGITNLGKDPCKVTKTLLK